VLAEFYYRNVLVCSVRAVPVGKHQGPASLENRIVCDRVGPVMITGEKKPRGNEIPVCQGKCIRDFFPVNGKFFL
jgi:hypothetical protein